MSWSHVASALSVPNAVATWGRPSIFDIQRIGMVGVCVCTRIEAVPQANLPPIDDAHTVKD